MTLAFGLLALVLSAVLGVLGWVLVSHSMLGASETSAVRETTLDADTLSLALRSEQSQLPQLLDGLADSAVTSSVLDLRGRWYATSPIIGPSALPAAMIDAVRRSQVARQRFVLDGRPYLAVGTPLSESGDLYFEVFSLTDLDHSLRLLSGALIAAAVSTSVLGLGLGRLATTLALRPLARWTGAAAAVAGGDLTARLPDDGDPDLRDLAIGFNRTAQSLEQRVVSDARFAGDVSHELRTPLTTMLNSMEVVRHRERDLPPAVREPLSLLQLELQRFRGLVIDLLEISRHDAGELAHLEPAVLGDLVRAAADVAAGRAVTVVDPAVARRVLLVDMRRLEQVVTNLVRNAETHGGGCLVVHVAGEQPWLRIEVDDAGPGIPARLRERVFERFFRTGHDSGGSGLGLAIAQRHVQLHHGRIWAQDRPGSGTRFVVLLPEGAD